MTSSPFYKLPLLLLFLLLFVHTSAAEVQQVILLLGHGFGSGTERLWLQDNKQSSLDNFPVKTALSSLNQDNQVCDAASAGTALACGQKTLNGKIGLDGAGQPLTSLAKMLQARKWRIGLITTGALNHALPASFYANRDHPSQTRPLLGDMVISQFDLLAGSNFLAPENYRHTHFANLLKRGNYLQYSTLEWEKIVPGKKQLLLGDFNLNWPGISDNSPTLAEMTAKALKVLPNKHGFLLVIVADAEKHQNQLLDSTAVMRIRDSFEKTIDIALTFQQQHRQNTLVIATTSYDADSLKNATDKTAPSACYLQQQLPAQMLLPELQKQLIAGIEAAEIWRWLQQQIGCNESKGDQEKAWLQLFAKVDKNKDASQAASQLLAKALQLRDQNAGLAWGDGKATAAPVTAYACGPGQEQLQKMQHQVDLPQMLAQLLPTANIDFASECRQLPLPPPRGRKHLNCLLPLSADDKSITLRYGLLKMPVNPLKATLHDAAGTEIALLAGEGRCGFLTFNNLQPATKYQVIFELDGEQTKIEGLETLPIPPGEKLFTFALLADTHLSLSPDLPSGRLHSSSVPIMARIIAELNQLQIPLMLHVGDVTDASTLEEFAALEHILPAFQGKSFFVPGNHDRLRGELAQRWSNLLGPTAGLNTFQGIQILSLDTANGRLGNPGNLAAIAAFDLQKPAIIISHFQLIPDPEQIKDSHAAISDREQHQEALARLGQAKAVIYVGHKNVPCLTKLGQVTQINTPQTTQFVDGYLLVDVYSSGVAHRFMPASTAYISERSRLCGGAGMTRARNNFKIWNCFLPWPER